MEMYGSLNGDGGESFREFLSIRYAGFLTMG